MIFDAVISWALGSVEWLFSLLPVDTIDWPDVTGFGTWAGLKIGTLNPLIPAEEVSAILVLTVGVVVPAVLIFRLTLWLYGKIPVIGS